MMHNSLFPVYITAECTSHSPQLCLILSYLTELTRPRNDPELKLLTGAHFPLLPAGVLHCFSLNEMKERRGLILLSYLVTQDMLHLWWGVVWSTVYCGAERCAVLSLHPDLVAVKLAWLECLVTGMQSRTARPDPAPLSAHYLTYKPRTSLHHYIHTKGSQARPALSEDITRSLPPLETRLRPDDDDPLCLSLM